MPDLPTGTVTFLFTDIVGSTRLWEHHPDAMRPSLARHAALLHAAIDAHAGHVFKTVGDAFCAAFPTAPDALAAALAAQRSLAAEPWPDATPIRVRMGLHTGVADAEGGDYFGQTLNRVARLMSAGHGGQTLLSAAAWELVRDDLPEGVTLRDLGERRLKDLRQPEHVFQLLAPDLPADFPPLATLDARPNNLPIQPTSLVGREADVAELTRQLRAADGPRMVTLTGPGGTGKTRLALAAAAELIDDFAHGVWFVELAPLADGALVASSVATVLGIRGDSEQPLADSLAVHLRDKALLLVLDNSEHLLDACARLADRLTRECAGVAILATSREPLGIPAERAWPVSPLAAPDPVHNTTITAESVQQFEAVRLFLDRAQAVQPNFRVTNANAPAIAEICRRLDGIPLAIELAAARARALTPEDIAARLDERFRLLTGGSRTALPRHQTLLACVAWSYELLSKMEQRVFQRLGVFAGRIPLAAAEVACAGDGVDEGDVLDAVTNLVARSLVVAETGAATATYRLLDTLWAFALERLAEAGDEEATRDRHLGWYSSFASESFAQMFGPDASEWMDLLESQHDNLRAALSWGLTSREPGASEHAVRTAVALQRFWTHRGYAREALGWFEAACSSVAAELQPELLAATVYHRGLFQLSLGDLAASQTSFEQALGALRALGVTDVAVVLQDLANAKMMLGALDEAAELAEESLALKRQLGAPPWHIAICVQNRGELARMRGDFTTAKTAYDEAIDLIEQFGGDPSIIPWCTHNLALIALRSGDLPRAREMLEKSLSLSRDGGFRPIVVACLAGQAGVLTAEGDATSAARLLGASDRLGEVTGSPLQFADEADRDHNEAIARQQLTPEAWAAAYAEGQAMTEDEAVAYAVGWRRGRTRDGAGVGDGAVDAAVGGA